MLAEEVDANGDVFSAALLEVNGGSLTLVIMF